MRENVRAAPGDDLHAERLAEADEAQRLALDVHAERELPVLAGLHPGVLPADPPGQLQHQAEGDAGGRVAVAGGAADRDAALLAGLHVDRGVVGAGGDQELELGQRLDDRTGKGRAKYRGRRSETSIVVVKTKTSSIPPV